MRYLSRVLTSTALLSAIGIVDGAIIMQPNDIDLHQQRIGILNIEERVGTSLPKSSDSRPFTLNLSDNTITDADVSKLVGTIDSHSLIGYLQKLDLSNNRLTLEGVTTLVPLLCSENFQWLDISINNLMVDDFQSLWQAIESEALRVSIISEYTESFEALRDKWASKVVLLPKNYTVDRFPLQLPFVNAHRRYYGSP
jgi:hypothetical protein